MPFKKMMAKASRAMRRSAKSGKQTHVHNCHPADVTMLVVYKMLNFASCQVIRSSVLLVMAILALCCLMGFLGAEHFYWVGSGVANQQCWNNNNLQTTLIYVTVDSQSLLLNFYFWALTGALIFFCSLLYFSLAPKSMPMTECDFSCDIDGK